MTVLPITKMDPSAPLPEGGFAYPPQREQGAGQHWRHFDGLRKRSEYGQDFFHGINSPVDRIRG